MLIPATIRHQRRSFLVSGFNLRDGSDSFKVLYYSNDILSKSLPGLGPYVSLGITVVNVIMTFPPIILIEVRQLPPVTSFLHRLIVDWYSAWAEGSCSLSQYWAH